MTLAPTCCQAFDSEVTTSFYDLALSRPVVETRSPACETNALQLSHRGGSREFRAADTEINVNTSLGSSMALIPDPKVIKLSRGRIELRAPNCTRIHEVEVIKLFHTRTHTQVEYKSAISRARSIAYLEPYSKLFLRKMLFTTKSVGHNLIYVEIPHLWEFHKSKCNLLKGGGGYAPTCLQII